jgi:SAM-dependent methyltransferase
MRHGWFIIPGLQTGDRTFGDQAAGLEPAFATCAGKSVLDLGCAEGLLAHEFARRGAREVHGLELVREHVAVARQLAAGLNCTFEVANLQEVVQSEPARGYDIVCALAVIHKIRDMKRALKWCARSAAELLLIRTGRKYESDHMVSKRDTKIAVNVPAVLKSEGFDLDQTVEGSEKHHEGVQYWRRVR